MGEPTAFDRRIVDAVVLGHGIQGCDKKEATI